MNPSVFSWWTQVQQEPYSVGKFNAPLAEHVGNPLRAVTGTDIEQYGQQRPSVVLGSGTHAMVAGTVANTRQSVLAVSSTADKGFTTVF